ncbi:MAG: 7-cyano-7-deazaguanine synthase [Candidatus Omnitrophica bacterium]|nr:7-cyano-7-deazaguanine synthase [Candidatus Omnitrophota bacterium]
MNGRPSVRRGRSAVVLVSGGVESAALLSSSDRSVRLHPLYVRCGLRWEAAELHWLRRLLGAVSSARVAPLTLADLPVAQLYAGHWSLGSGPVPGTRTLDRAVHLPARNLLLASVAAAHAERCRAGELWIGTLASNPFGDASTGFFRALSAAASAAVGRRLRITRPLIGSDKAAILRRLDRAGAPHELSFSCIDPRGYLHCGRCNKCAERAKAYAEAGLADPTVYAWGSRR